MKVIDLLNKIANGEEVPNKFKFAHQTFRKEGSCYIDEDGDSITYSIFNDFSNINDEIEIIEEDKPINKLKLYTNYEILEDNIRTTREICFKINEIIDRLNKLEGSKNEKTN